MTRFRSRRVLALAAAAVASGLTAFLLVSPGAAGASGSSAPAVPPPPAHPTSADQIQNIDQVKTAIKAYYGDQLDPNTVDPVTGLKDLHTFDPHGAYADEMQGIVVRAERYLQNPANHGGGTGTGTKAVLFDVDDTTLNTYNYEIFSNFVYNPTTNAAFVNAGVFPAVPHMVGLEHYAEHNGYTVFFLTGRPISQAAATVANLQNDGYDVTASNLYTKDASGATEPWLAPCAPTCTTIQYKSLTRQHIESLGYNIEANFGDQYSDLKGGFAEKTFKLPNPMYYLP